MMVYNCFRGKAKFMYDINRYNWTLMSRKEKNTKGKKSITQDIV